MDDRNALVVCVGGDGNDGLATGIWCHWEASLVVLDDSTTWSMILTADQLAGNL